MLKFLDEYRDPELCLEISDRIKALSRKRINIMEVCGGHTMSIRRNGIDRLIGDRIRLISGPGCPVCVTSIEDIDRAVAFADLDGVAICTFGDLFHVPGSYSSLAEKKAQGADVRIVYSVSNVLDFAKNERGKDFIFISIGFETSSPAVAAAIVQAETERISNFYVLCLNKTMPHALRAILEDEATDIDALICPGHVSTITGMGIYRFIADEIGIPCCISGFEPADIMRSIYILAEMCEKNRADVVNAYERAVMDEGNTKAMRILEDVFTEFDASWRGLGIIPSSGLRLKEAYIGFDALKKFDVDIPEPKPEPACLCGDILRGAKEPQDCSLFGRACTPSVPKGACMVSSEGSCAAYYRYKGGPWQS